jgi:hypothetical protein
MPLNRRKGRKPLFAGAALHVGTRLVGHAVRKYGPRAVVGTAAAGGVYAGAKSLVGRKKRNVNKAQYKKYKPKSAGNDAYAQQSYTRIVQGSRLDDRSLVDRAVKATVERTVYQHRKYANDGTNVNNYAQPLAQIVTAGKRYLPVYIADLTRINQTHIIDSNFKVSFMRRMYMDTAPGASDGKIKWEDVDGIGADGSTPSPFLFIAEDKSLAPRQKPIAKSIMNWVSIKLNLMGARTRPGYFKVQIVTLGDDEHLDPWTKDGILPQHGAFWQDHVARLTCNTIHDLPKKTKTKMHVLLEKTIAWQPTSTTESDTRAHVDTVNIFYRPNKTIIYQDGSANAGQSTLITDDEQIAVTNAQSASRGVGCGEFALKNKMYLLVSAFNPYSETAFNPAVHPSFEWNIKTSHIVLDT